MPSNWLVFDRIRALAKQHRIFQAERPYQDQPNLDKLTAGGEFLDFNQQSAILDQTNLQINRLERYKDYEQMDQTGEVSLALDLYADETSLVDPERKHTLIIRARNRRLKSELEDLFFNTLRWDTYCRPTVRYLCKYGDAPFEVVLDANRSGVSALKFMNVYNFTRIETRYGDLVGFFYMDAIWPRPIFLHPWQVMHLRLTSFENIYHPYGRSIIDGGRKAFKQLRLMEDAALIYRITRAPEKRKFTIPVGMIPPKEVPEYMQMIARNFKRQRFYNPTTGTFDERYSPLIQEDDFFLPRRPDGSGPDVDVLPGAENLDQIKDIEYFKKKMIAPTKIPFSRVGIGDDAGGASEKSLSQSHSEFAKAVQWVQREVATGLTKVAIIHLALRGYRVEDFRGFEVALTATSAMEELYRIETWQTRVAVMADLKELGWFPKEWIVTHFTDLTPDEIMELKEMEQAATDAGEPGGGLDNQGGQMGGMMGGGALGGMGNLGGMGDIGTDTDLGGGDLGNAGMGAGAQDMGAGAQGMGAGAQGMSPPPLEGFDYDAERKLINEMAEQYRDSKARDMLDRWSKRLGKSKSNTNIQYSSGFEHIRESKELDGLTRNKTKDGSNGTILESIHDPNGDEGLIFKWTIPKGIRDEVIKEVYDVITNNSSDHTLQSGADDITEEDVIRAASNNS